MSKYNIWIDPRAAKTRAQLRSLELSDLASSTMRWALHLSEEELRYLEEHNPDTLGVVPDSLLYKQEWMRFLNHPESNPFKVQRI